MKRLLATAVYAHPPLALNQRRRGFSIVETLVYISVFSGVFALIIPVLVILSQAQRRIYSFHTINSAAAVSMERITRDVRSASSIDLAGSVFGVHPGELTVVEVEGAVSTTTRFYLESGALMVDENGVAQGALSENASVVSLVFRRIETASSEGIRIELQLSDSSGTAVEQAAFYSTAFARGSY